MHDELFVKLRRSALANEAGVTFTEFRKTLTPKWGVVWAHIAMGWTALILSNVALCLLVGRHWAVDVLLVGGSSILIGFMITYLYLFIQ